VLHQAEHVIPQARQPRESLKHDVLALPQPHQLRQLLLGLQRRGRAGGGMGARDARSVRDGD
jgi:hypothetical protein